MGLILASASPRRKELLSELVREFLIRAADIPEDLNPHLADLSAQIEELSLRKAQAVAELEPHNSYVLGADTVVVVDGEILGKPTDAADAQRMLEKLSDQWHEVLTGVALVKTGLPPQNYSGHGLSRVKMRKLSEQEILDYIAGGEPMDKAGAYAIQGGAAAFVEVVEGRWDTIVGLPLDTVENLLKAANYPL
ncbi:MAG: septum formation protein Maf [Candidatus Sericytochromatia bacterium]|nr:septum formation protein Maf [Candidatus Sericytochromatia bacterium]